jgi:regulatory protein
MDNPYYERLVNAAIRFVSFRPHSEKEMTDFLNKKLTRWKVSGAGLIAKVIGRMEELGYVDDEKFAQWWADQRTTFKPKGNRYIQMELKGKGVPDAVIASVLAPRGSQSLQEAAKRAIGRKRFESRQKLYNYLLRRGFDADTIKRVKYDIKIFGD